MGNIVKGRGKAAAFMALLMLILFVFGSLSGCGSAYKQSAEDSVQPGAPEYRVENRDYGSDGMPSSQTVEYDKSGSALPQERKVIQDVSLLLSVNDVSQAIDRIMKIAEENQGYTVSSNLARGQDWVRGEVSIKVPSPRLNTVTQAITDLGEIRDKSVSTQDVTEEYYDSQARLAVLNKKEERLLALMDEAKTIEEIIKVENELTRVRTDIEVLQGRLKYLDNATGYSSISVSLNQSSGSKVEVPKGTMGKALKSFIESTNNLAEFMSDFFIILVALIPWAIVLALLFWLLWLGKNKYHWGFKRNKKRPDDSPPRKE
jgi:hypothetical protein